jgi:hypothetical protein
MSGEHAQVDFGGVSKEANVSLVEAKVGDYVIVHAGFAIQIVDEEGQGDHTAMGGHARPVPAAELTEGKPLSSISDAILPNPKGASGDRRREMVDRCERCTVLPSRGVWGASLTWT